MREEGLSEVEEMSCAYVAGWLETKCKDLDISDTEWEVSGKPLEFIEEVSRGSLTIPHVVTFEFVKAGLQYINSEKTDACCRHKLGCVLRTICTYSDYGLSASKELITRLSNVLLHGLHNLAKDQQTNQKLYQTSIKKARLA